MPQFSAIGITAEGQLTTELPTEPAGSVNDCKGRVVRLGHQAGFRVKQPLEQPYRRSTDWLVVAGLQRSHSCPKRLLANNCTNIGFGRELIGEPTTTLSAPATPSAQPNTPIELVNGKSDVGHRDFANATKALPKVFDGAEEDFYSGCKKTGKGVDFASCGYP